MANKLTQEEVIKKFKKIHGHTYDYSLVQYKNMRTKVTIICKKHGEFKQLPHGHIHNKRGCLKCANDSFILGKEEFVKRANQIHNNKHLYELVNYKNAFTKVIIGCKKHGNFEQIPNNHLAGRGCPKCHRFSKRTTEEFVNESIKIHRDKYIYDNVIYNGSKYKVEIKCPSHGIFRQEPRQHLQGNGCPDCNLRGGLNKKFFEKFPNEKDKKSILYFIKISDEEEIFYKVGITCKSINKRFQTKFGYNYEIISTVNMTLYESFLEEEKFMKNFSNYKYIPNRKIYGWTECFRKEIYDIMFNNH